MKVAIMGYGTIGSGVAEILEVNRDVIAKRAGEPLELKYVLDLRDFEGEPVADKVVHDYRVIAEDEEIAIVVETMGGVEPAYTFVNAMLEAGKHVATSNKALVAEKGAQLVETARKHKVNFLFEASVGGGIPIIRSLQECLTGDVIEEIMGIVNGTTNYILTKMSAEGCEFEDVLKTAQKKGYAEKDPTADIEGHDACRKIAILTSLVCGQQVDYQDIPTQGISGISAVDMKYAKKMGRVIKLLATSKKNGGSYTARVAPYLLAPEHPLCNVDGVFNAIMVRGNMLGDAMFYGSGAGKLPTASAVLGDMVEIARHVGMHIPLEWKAEKLELLDPGNQACRFFVRTRATEDVVDGIFGQVTYLDAEAEDETGFITGCVEEDIFAQKAQAMGGLLQYIRLA